MSRGVGVVWGTMAPLHSTWHIPCSPPILSEEALELGWEQQCDGGRWHGRASGLRENSMCKCPVVCVCADVREQGGLWGRLGSG